MIHPRLIGVRNLVFDMDGTLIGSGQIAVGSLRSSLNSFFHDKGLAPPPYTDEELVKGIGAPSDEFYRALLPEDMKPDWKQFRSYVFQAEHEQLKSHQITFPGVHKTLAILRARGYSMHLVSNCGRGYMDAVLETQNLRDHFDSTACIGDEEGVTKTELIRRVAEQSSAPTAVIGDRHYDVDAANANNLPSIGCLYGYGTREELANTTSWVEDVRHLAFLFNPLREAAVAVATEVNRRRSNDLPFVLGLESAHEAYTHPFSELLITALSDANIPTLHLRLEEHRADHPEITDPLEWIQASYPWEVLKNQVLAPRGSGEINAPFPVQQPVSRDPVGSTRPLRVRNGQVLVVEAPFLRGDWLQDQSFDGLVIVDLNLDDVDTVLSSAEVCTDHAEVCGAATMPFWEEHLPALEQGWRQRRRDAVLAAWEIGAAWKANFTAVLDGHRMPEGLVELG